MHLSLRVFVSISRVVFPCLLVSLTLALDPTSLCPSPLSPLPISLLLHKFQRYCDIASVSDIDGEKITGEEQASRINFPS